MKFRSKNRSLPQNSFMVKFVSIDICRNRSSILAGRFTRIERKMDRNRADLVLAFVLGTGGRRRHFSSFEAGGVVVVERR